VNITGAGFVSLLLLYHPPDLSSPGIPLPDGRVDRRRPSMSYAGQHITLIPSRTSHPRAMPHQFLFPPVRPSVRGRPDERISTLRSRNAFLKECSIVSARPANPNDFSPSLVIFIYLRFIHISLFLRAALLPSSIRRDLPSPSPPPPPLFLFRGFDERRIEIPKFGLHLQLVGEQGVSLSMRIPEAYFIKRHFLFRSITTGRLFDFLVKGKVVPPSEECVAACVGCRYHRAPCIRACSAHLAASCILEVQLHSTFRKTVSPFCQSSRTTYTDGR